MTESRDDSHTDPHTDPQSDPQSDPQNDPRNDAVHRRARAQFAASGDAYVHSPGHARGTELGEMVALVEGWLGPPAGLPVLDVATGGGHTALAFARAGAAVTATDLTPEMLRAARAFVTAELPSGAAPEVRFVEAPAERMPLPDAGFGVVACRIAAHHFADPQAFVAEAARLLRPGGLLLLVDNVAPEHDALDEAMNRIERERDPSHVRAWRVSQWTAWLAARRLDPLYLRRWRTRKRFREWLARARTPEAAAEALERYVLALPADARAYFEVEAAGGRLERLSHEAVLLAAQKR